MRKDFTGHDPKLIDMGRMRSQGSIYSGGTKSAIDDRIKRRKILAGYPLDPFNMTSEQIDNYFSGEVIVCLLCGKKYRCINTAHLLNVHGTTIEKYQSMFGLPFGKGLLCGGLHNIRAEQGKSKIKYLKPYDGVKKRKEARLNAYAIEKRKKNIKVAASYLPEKLTENDMIKIRKQYSRGKWNQREIAAKYGVSQSTISHVINSNSEIKP